MIPKKEDRAASPSATRRPITAKKIRCLPQPKCETLQEENQAFNLDDLLPICGLEPLNQFNYSISIHTLETIIIIPQHPLFSWPQH